MKQLLATAFALLIGCTPINGFPTADCGNLTPVPYQDMTICVTPDVYMVDGVRMPVDLHEAHQIANERGMRLPTPEMVDAIWAASDIKLSPIYMTPDSTMTTLRVFREHDRLIDAQLAEINGNDLRMLIAGHKKTIVDWPIDSTTIAIYGWIKPDGEKIQELNTTSHWWGYKDYSHGLRLVATYGIRNGRRVPLK